MQMNTGCGAKKGTCPAQFERKAYRGKLAGEAGACTRLWRMKFVQESKRGREVISGRWDGSGRDLRYAVAGVCCSQVV